MQSSASDKWLCESVPYEVSLPLWKHVRNNSFVLHFEMLYSLYGT